MKKIAIIFTLITVLISCGKKNHKMEKKGFQISDIVNDDEEVEDKGLPFDSLEFETRPRNVLLTADASHRLTPIYKVNYDKKTKKPWVGGNQYHYSYSEYGNRKGNNWNYNLMPGFEALYGYNFVNVSHYNTQTQAANTFFEDPVLIKTVYYPSYTNDTLNSKHVTRDYYLVSVYDKDSNQDGFLNWKDLRSFYHFDMEADSSTRIIPKNYSVMSSEYDPANDFMYIFTRLDENSDGQMQSKEGIHIFWIDLKNPMNHGKVYGE